MGTPGAAAPIERLRREHAGRRIVLAEDNPISRVIAQELLRVPGLSVEVVGDGAAAVAAVARGGVDLVLMDVQMPGMSGIEAAQALRAAGAVLPIVAMTGDAEARDHAACLAAGMNDHLAKPVQASRLYETLLRWLPAGDATLAQRLARVDGLDPAVGLASVGGALPALARVLRRFADTYRGGVPDLAAPTTRPARHAAAHALRGVAATLGAVELQGRLEDLQRADAAALDDAELDLLAGQALDELRALIAALDDTLDR